MNLKKQLVAFVLAIVALVTPMLTVPANADETSTAVTAETVTATVAVDDTTAVVKLANVHIDERCIESSFVEVNPVYCVSKIDKKFRAIKDGVVIKKFDARLGRPGLRTRSGVFHVYGKEANAFSNLYHVLMPYSVKFDRGQYIHYSSEFNKLGYGYPYGSHGCVNLRNMSDAVWVYDHAKANSPGKQDGTLVIVS